MDTNVGLQWDFPTDSTKIIKVIGVGGGGVNAVDFMYKNGIHGVNFAVCNTDQQSFQDVGVPVKVTLGEGLGAGGKPEKAKLEFEKSSKEVEKLFSDGTRMAFIAAGMGGGTGSGAAPLLARMAKDKGILTVGIVTIPFKFEKVPRIIQALDAVEEMSRSVDALIVINNERLKKYYPDFDLEEAFKKPNEVLAMAVKSIAEIITVKGIINRDFNDVTSTMKDSGIALVSYGFGQGENRLENAIQEALDSPLLHKSDISNAKRILFYITFKPDSHFKVDELSQSMDAFMGRFDNHIEMIWGCGIDTSLKDDQEIKFTIIATGFGLQDVPEMNENRIIQIQEEEKRRAEDEERVKEVYGEDINNIKINRVTSSSIIILTDEELYDDELITYMEENPPYKRLSKDIAKARKTVIKEPQAEKKPVTSSESADSEDFSVINF